MTGVPEERLPKDFGKYRLVRRIATGGMAEIFLAHRHDAPHEPLVIKRILPHLTEGGEFVSMFLDEARIAANLKHKNIAEVFDIGQIEGAYFIAMEYVHGEDIRRIYNRAYKLQRSLPLSHSIRVIADAALGLGYAHKFEDPTTRRTNNVVHRDVSPQNILVTYEGGVKVIDFGIARASNKVNRTRAGVLKGKYSYMSPEQAMGDPIDQRTDIFALGIILYETTTGIRLFKKHNELATLQSIIKCEIMPPSDALRGYPVELEQIVMKALAKRPEDRFQEAEHLSDDLYHFLRTSGLYVEPEVIANFMQDLFAERLEEEKSSGEPAVPEEHEVREEMVEATSQISVEAYSDALERVEQLVKDIAGDLLDGSGEATSEDAQPTPAPSLSGSVRPSTVNGRAGRGSGFLDDDRSAVDGTIPEKDLEDIRPERPGNKRKMTPSTRPPPKPDASSSPSNPLRDAKRIQSEAPRSGVAMRGTVPPETTVPPSKRPAKNGAAGAAGAADFGDEMTASGDAAPADTLPTVTAQPAYREPGAKAKAKPTDRTLPPERASRQAIADKTDYVRAKRASVEPKAAPAEAIEAEPKARAGFQTAGRTALIPDPRRALGKGLLPWVIVGLLVFASVALAVTLLVSRRTPKQIPAAPAPREAPETAEAPQAPAAAPSAEGEGEVHIITEPQASVWSGEASLGRADNSGNVGPIKLPAGRHVVRVVVAARGFERVRAIEVRAGQIHEFEIRARQGWLKLAVAPWAKVQVDGKDRGITPLADLVLDEGTHHVVLENPDIKKRHDALIRVEPNKISQLRVDLTQVGEPL